MSLEENRTEILRVKENPAWRLLASDKGPLVLALIKSALFDDNRERVLGASTMILRIEDGLAKLRELDEAMPRTAQEYIGQWVSSGWLIRSFPAGALEERYEPSAAAIDAIHFVSNLAHPQPAMTESRLATVIQNLAKLAEDTDPDTARRVAFLNEEIERLRSKIEAIDSGRLGVIPDERAVELAMEITSLAEVLVEDFRRVMDEFERLSRSFRESIHVSGESRGEVLADVFKGVYDLERTEAGRTFAAFYRLLNDDVQQGILTESLARVAGRDFFKSVDPKVRSFLENLIDDLIDRAAAISRVTLELDLSLRRFVEGPEYLRGRRLAALLQEAQRAAHEAKDRLGPTARLATRLDLVRKPIMSVSQLRWIPKPPRTPLEPFREAERPSEVDLGLVRQALTAGEIDLRTLKENVLAVLATRETATVVEVLDRFPAVQGLASVVGLIHLAHRHGERVPDLRETAGWTGLDGEVRSSRIDQWRFIRERADELME